MNRTLSSRILPFALPALLLMACAGPDPAPVCAAPSLFRFEQQSMNEAMEQAFNHVDFRFCKNRRCWVEFQGASECEAQVVGECLTRHLVAAQGVPAASPAQADLKLLYHVERIGVDTAQRIWTPDLQTAEFLGQLRVSDAASGALEHQYNLQGVVRHAVLQ